MQTNPFKVGDKIRQKSSTMLSEVLGGLYYSDYLGQKIHIVYDVTPPCVMLDDDAEWWWERFELVEEKVQEEVKSEEKVPTLKEKFWWGIVNDKNEILGLQTTRQDARHVKRYFYDDSTKIKKVKLTVME